MRQYGLRTSRSDVDEPGVREVQDDRSRRRLLTTIRRYIGSYLPEEYDIGPGSMLLGLVVLNASEAKALGKLVRAVRTGQDDAKVGRYADELCATIGGGETCPISASLMQPDEDRETTPWPEDVK